MQFKTFNFIAKENNLIVGILTGHTYYKEIYIEDLIVIEQYRHKYIGSKLVKKVEEFYKGKEFENIKWKPCVGKFNECSI